MAVAAAPLPPQPLFAKLGKPRGVLVLLLLTWLPLVAYVMFRRQLGDLGNYILLPAIPAALLLYALAVWSWRESPVAIIGATLVFFWLILAVTAPYLPLADPNKPVAPFVTPFTEKNGVFYWLGTDTRGRDLLSRTIWGCQRVLVWGITATATAYVVGTMIGLIAGYLGGWWDQIVSFFANVLLSFPVMVLFILILNYLGPSGFNIVIAVTFSSAPQIMRIVRGLALDVKSRDYIFAAQTRGESALRIMVVELLPNVRGPLIVDACLRLGYVTITIALLGYLSLGLPPPFPDWGKMISGAQKFGSFGMNAMLWPAFAISSLVLGLNLLADGIREISLRD